MSALAPAATERWALSRFATPTRNRHGGPKAPGGHRFTLPGRNGDLAAWDFGDGPTVLLAHGWSGHAAQMSAFVPALVAAGYHVVCFDQPAHGHSGGRRTNMLEFRDAVLTVGRRLGPLAGVIAHSLGATASAAGAGSRAARRPPGADGAAHRSHPLRLGVRQPRRPAARRAPRGWSSCCAISCTPISAAGTRSRRRQRHAIRCW